MLVDITDETGNLIRDSSTDTKHYKKPYFHKESKEYVYPGLNYGGFWA